MIIPNKFIKLEYNPATDVLWVEWPNIDEESVPELQFILSELLGTIRNYDVKKVLADSTKSVLSLADETYNAIVEQLVLDLRTTRLQKFARLTIGEGSREVAANKAADALKDKFEMRNFNNLNDALEWLNS
ncbi:hypothetical protein [uncultured Pontibacter sp.]|uniref:hypothetical protein n=1 Tax=uncultured Pontibacter sp. TaxID=453356 RepID=UPI0026223A96|nr:hypothetical protein [uncultured Pontibacter sp.]